MIMTRSIVPLFLLVGTLLSPAHAFNFVSRRRGELLLSMEPIASKTRVLKTITQVAVPLLLLPSLPAFAGIMAAEDRLREQPPDRYQDASVAVMGVKPDYKALREDIANLIREKPDKGPTLLRLAWHSSGTYDKISKTGGSNGGTIRFEQELKHGANGGLDLPIAWLEPIYKKYNRNADLSYADLYTLAGVVAVSTLRGPSIPWRAGRVDYYDPSKVTPDGRLPEADLGSPKST